ncbi:4479_t:CDS:2, partial [Dentiscutata erythropus]
KQRTSRLWGLLWRGGAVFLAGNLIYLWWVNKSNETPQKIFRPGEDHSYYNVVCSEHETGKTTLTIKVAREIGKGIIYVDTPADIEEFGNSFGKALNLIFDEDAMLIL